MRVPHNAILEKIEVFIFSGFSEFFKTAPFLSAIKNQHCLDVHWKFCKCFQNNKDKSKVMLFFFFSVTIPLEGLSCCPVNCFQHLSRVFRYLSFPNLWPSWLSITKKTMNIFCDHFTSKMKRGLSYPFKWGSSIMPFLKQLKFFFKYVWILQQDWLN